VATATTPWIYVKLCNLHAGLNGGPCDSLSTCFLHLCLCVFFGCQIGSFLGVKLGLSISLPRLQTSSGSVPHLSWDLWCFDDMLGSSMRRGRAPADNSEVLAMFRLQYSGEGATQPLVDDAS